MSLFANPTEHAANPPESWSVVKHGSKWHLQAVGVTLESFTTRKAAIAAKDESFSTRLYAKETRWYAGEPVEGWKPYST